MNHKDINIKIQNLMGHYSFENTNGTFNRNIRISEYGCNIIDDIISSIFKESLEIASTLSRDSVKSVLQNVIIKHKNGEISGISNISKFILNECLNKQLFETEVFHEIYGITISGDTPPQNGYFKFYDFDKDSIKNQFSNTYFSDDPKYINDEKLLLKKGTWISTFVKTRDFKKAHSIAYQRFEELQNILRYLISFVNGKCANYGSWRDIGIFNYKGNETDKYIIMTSDGIPWQEQNGVENFKLIDYYVLKNTGKSFFPNEISFDGLLEFCCKESKNEMEKRLFAALNFYGRAYYNFASPMCFLEGMMAIEALLQCSTGQLVNSSISAQISDNCAFLLEKTYEKRKTIVKKLKYLYGIRSKLAHGNNSSISVSDMIDVLCYSRELITIFIVNPNISKCIKFDHLQELIDRQKYC